jgi:hypothetical protein
MSNINLAKENFHTLALPAWKLILWGSLLKQYEENNPHFSLVIAVCNPLFSGSGFRQGHPDRNLWQCRIKPAGKDYHQIHYGGDESLAWI